MRDEYVLAIETSSKGAGIALACRRNLLAVHAVDAAVGVAADLVPSIKSALSEHGLRAMDVGIVAFSAGPGSFTGLRVAATVARTLHDAAGCRVVAVPTLSVVASNALKAPALRDSGDEAHVAPILDAKRGQVYGAAFAIHQADARGVPQVGGRHLAGSAESSDGPVLVPQGPPAVREPRAWLSGIAKPLFVVGEGIEAHRAACEAAGAIVLEREFWTPVAETVAAIGWRMAQEGRTCAPAEIVPLYVRPPECEEVYERRRVEAKARRGM